MIIEATMFIISDDEESLIPKRRASESFINVFHESFSFTHTMVWMLIIHKSIRFSENIFRIEGISRIDERVVREITNSSIMIKPLHWREKSSVIIIIIEVTDVREPVWWISFLIISPSFVVLRKNFLKCNISNISYRLLVAIATITCTSMEKQSVWIGASRITCEKSIELSKFIC